MESEQGYIYLIKSQYGYKIGRSKTPKKRYNLFSVKLPFEIELIRCVKVYDYIKCESFLHDLFSQCRLNGEWFYLDEKLIEKFDLEIKPFTYLHKRSLSDIEQTLKRWSFGGYVKGFHFFKLKRKGRLIEFNCLSFHDALNYQACLKTDICVPFFTDQYIDYELHFKVFDEYYHNNVEFYGENSLIYSNYRKFCEKRLYQLCVENDLKLVKVKIKSSFMQKNNRL